MRTDFHIEADIDVGILTATITALCLEVAAKFSRCRRGERCHILMKM